MCNAVDSYLLSQGMSKAGNGRRDIKVTSGVGRVGDVNLYKSEVASIPELLLSVQERS